MLRLEYDRLSDARLDNSSAAIQSRVEAARERQRWRFSAGKDGRPPALTCNADVRPTEVRRFCNLDDTSRFYTISFQNKA